MLTVRHDDADVIAGPGGRGRRLRGQGLGPGVGPGPRPAADPVPPTGGHDDAQRQLVQVGRLLAGIIHEIRGPLSVIRGSAELLRLRPQPDDPDLPVGRPDPPRDSSASGPARSPHGRRPRRPPAAPGPRPPARDSRGGRPVREGVADPESRCPHPGGLRSSAVRRSPCRRRPADPGADQSADQRPSGDHQRTGRKASSTSASSPTGESESSWVKIDVEDDGPGIPETYLARIFEPFFTTKEGGSGYGLYLCSEILGEQGGRLTACNHPGGGACFTIWLPRGPGKSSLGRRGPRRQSEREARPRSLMLRDSIPGSRKTAGRIGHGRLIPSRVTGIRPRPRTSSVPDLPGLGRCTSSSASLGSRHGTRL